MPDEIEATKDAPIAPQWIAQSTDISREDNFPMGCSFSPDGLCIATATAADSTLRLYNTVHSTSQEEPEVQPWKTALASSAVGEIIRSYDWYPPMQSSDPATCCIAATGRDQPVHLIDAYTGGIRATYHPLNIMEELESPTVVKFSPQGDQIVTAGYRSERTIQIFDSASPGKSASTVLSLGKTKRSSDGQKGLVSALAFGQGENNCLLAVGTYAPGSIYLYDYRQGSRQPSGTIWQGGYCMVGHGKKYASKKRRLQEDDTTGESTEENTGDSTDLFFSRAKTQWYTQRAQRGITQLQFDDQGMLYSANRNGDAILVWDVRMLSGLSQFATTPIRGYTSFPIHAATNQRLEFALHGNRLWVGGLSEEVRVYDTTGGKLLQQVPIPGCVKGDAINGLSYNPTYDLLAIATGSRRFPALEDYDDDDDDNSNNEKEEEDIIPPPGSLQLYKWNSSNA